MNLIGAGHWTSEASTTARMIHWDPALRILWFDSNVSSTSQLCINKNYHGEKVDTVALSTWVTVRVCFILIRSTEKRLENGENRGRQRFVTLGTVTGRQCHLFVSDRLVVQLITAVGDTGSLLHCAEYHNFGIGVRLIINVWLCVIIKGP